jgi:hypothetical protein
MTSSDPENKLIPLGKWRKREIQKVLQLAMYRRIANSQTRDPDLLRLERSERRNVPGDSYDWDELTRQRVRGRRLE